MFSISKSAQVPAEKDMIYVDRGDPVSADFGPGDLGGGTWTELNLSAIVPAEAANKPVHLRVSARPGAGENELTLVEFRKNGNSNEANKGQVFAPYDPYTNTIYVFADMLIMLDANRKVEVKYTQTGAQGSAEITVAGWFI